MKVAQDNKFFESKKQATKLINPLPLCQQSDFILFCEIFTTCKQNEWKTESENLIQYTGLSN